MALQVLNLERKFTFKSEGTEITLHDIDPSFTPEQIMDHYSAHYPELTTGSIVGPTITDGAAHYQFTTNLGTKG